MEDKEWSPESGVKNSVDSQSVSQIRFTTSEERSYFIMLRGQLIKLLYMIEEERENQGDISLWFYGLIFDIASANVLCNNKLTKIVVKIHGLYDNDNYKTMTHSQIKRQIMECKGMLDYLIGDKT